jgi:DNA adenine methylase
MNPVIKYFGGKFSMLSNILKYFPNDYEIYCEPFGGSYSIGLNQKCRNEIYNDLDKNVYSLFKVLNNKYLFEQFKNKVDLNYYSENIREEFLSNLKKDDLSIIDRAYYFFYINRTSVNGIGGFSVSTHKRRKLSKSTSDYLSCCDRLEEFHQRLSTVIITNMDAIELLDRYDSKEKIFFYCDSPYVWETRSNARYDCDMDNSKQEKYIDTLIKLKSNCLVSGYKCDMYKKLEENGFTRIDFEVNTVNHNNEPKTKIESLWMNYPIEDTFPIINNKFF